MTDESEYKTKLVAQCRKLGAYARRIEDRAAVGVLDIIVAFDNMPVYFVEAKIVRGYNFGPTERQFVEGTRILGIKGGGVRPALVGWGEENGLMYVSEWTRSVPIKACLYQLKGDDFATTLWRLIRGQTQRASRQHT